VLLVMDSLLIIDRVDDFLELPLILGDLERVVIYHIYSLVLNFSSVSSWNHLLCLVDPHVSFPVDFMNHLLSKLGLQFFIEFILHVIYWGLRRNGRIL